MLTITGNVGYAIGTVCSNAFLPELAREVCNPGPYNAMEAEAERRWAENEHEPLLEEGGQEDGPSRGVIPRSLARAAGAVVHGAAGAHPQTEELPAPSAPVEPDGIASDVTSPHTDDLSCTTSRLSSTCTALGFFSGVSVLALLLIPVTLMSGSSFSLRLAVGLSGA